MFSSTSHNIRPADQVPFLSHARGIATGVNRQDSREELICCQITHETLRASEHSIIWVSGGGSSAHQLQGCEGRYNAYHKESFLQWYRGKSREDARDIATIKPLEQLSLYESCGSEWPCVRAVSLDQIPFLSSGHNLVHQPQSRRATLGQKILRAGFHCLFSAQVVLLLGVGSMMVPFVPYFLGGVNFLIAVGLISVTLMILGFALIGIARCCTNVDLNT